MPKSEDERIRELEAAIPEFREELSALRAEIGALGVGGMPPAGIGLMPGLLGAPFMAPGMGEAVPHLTPPWWWWWLLWLLFGPKNKITLRQACKWQRIGFGNRDYVIRNDGPGELEIVQHSNGVTPPSKATNSNKVAPDLEPGQSTNVANRDVEGNKYLWVHAKGAGCSGSWD